MYNTRRIILLQATVTPRCFVSCHLCHSYSINMTVLRGTSPWGNLGLFSSYPRHLLGQWYVFPTYLPRRKEDQGGVHVSRFIANYTSRHIFSSLWKTTTCVGWCFMLWPPYLPEGVLFFYIGGGLEGEGILLIFTSFCIEEKKQSCW